MISITDTVFSYAGSSFRISIPSFQIDQGSSVAVVGPSGSGKTTLLNLASGLLVPQTGEVTTNNVCVSSMSDEARRNFRLRNIGLVFQEFELLEHLSVLNNILLPCRISARVTFIHEHRERAEQLAKRVGIVDKLRRYPRTLSQGERQRVAICRALILEPPLLLCDEPTGNLDPANKDQVLEILFEYAESYGATLLTVTHDHEILRRFEKTIDASQFHAAGEISA